MKAPKQGDALHDALVFACGALAAMIVCAAAVVLAVNAQSHAMREQEPALSMAEPVYKPIPAGTYMPLYLQTEPQWAHFAYADGTIGDSGCGLACAAMAIKYMTTQDVTPATLADLVGASCLTGSVNDPSKFASWIISTYPEYDIQTTPKFYLLESALDKVNSGWMCFAGLAGDFGDSTYNGHVVLIWRSDDSGYWVRDPASAGNSARAFTADELQGVDFIYFVGIRGGNYGITGN